ncbi:MAG TPA: DUF721 domain-containing protein [Saprospiraceae bacterium]|nr:DUF721 domain-containing protein [Saprospiraceae bacterium]
MKEQDYSLQELLKAFADQKHLRDKYLNKKLEITWKSLYPAMAQFSSRFQYKNGILTVWISSSALKHELNFTKAKMLGQINEALGEALVSQLEFR